MAGVVKPETVKSAVSAGTSVAVASSVVTEPEVQEREMVTAAVLSSEKSLATLKVAELRVLVMVQAPMVTATFRQALSSAV